MKSNRGGNSYYRLSKMDRILKTIDESEVELSPLEIATKTMINHATVKVYLRRLLERGKIVQPYPGAYCNKITHGMIFAPLRVHNVCVVRENLPDKFFEVKVPDVVEWVGGIKILVQHGTQRRKVSGKICCDAGMDRNAVLFALRRVFELWGKKFGVSGDEDVLLKTFEVNRDYQGVRIDGPSCYTKKGLFDVIERIYQKEDDVVRHEVKVTKPMKVDEFQSLIQGGLSAYNFQQSIFMVMQRLEKLTESIKFQNEVISRQNRILEALINKKEEEAEDT